MLYCLLHADQSRDILNISLIKVRQTRLLKRIKFTEIILAYVSSRCDLKQLRPPPPQKNITY